MSKPTFVCPACQTPNRTLRDLLTCCPASLRVLTEAIDTETGARLSGVNLRHLLTGEHRERVERYLDRRLARHLDRLAA